MSQEDFTKYQGLTLIESEIILKENESTVINKTRICFKNI